MQGTAGRGAEVKAFIILAFSGFRGDEERDTRKAALRRMSSSSAQGGQCQWLPRELPRGYLRFLLVEQSVSEWDLA